MEMALNGLTHFWWTTFMLHGLHTCMFDYSVFTNFSPTGSEPILMYYNIRCINTNIHTDTVKKITLQMYWGKSTRWCCKHVLGSPNQKLWLWYEPPFNIVWTQQVCSCVAVMTQCPEWCVPHVWMLYTCLRFHTVHSPFGKLCLPPSYSLSGPDQGKFTWYFWNSASSTSSPFSSLDRWDVSEMLCHFVEHCFILSLFVFHLKSLSLLLLCLAMLAARLQGSLTDALPQHVTVALMIPWLFF